jgi:hypothetical protein
VARLLISLALPTLWVPHFARFAKGERQIDRTMSSLPLMPRTQNFTYDTAGNTLTDGNGAITYDAENRISTTNGVTYTYDGDGKRVEKSNGTLFWTGVGSDPLSESDLSGNINEEYVFFNGMRVSRIDRPSNTVHAFLADHLGSSRMSVVPLDERVGYCNIP